MQIQICSSTMEKIRTPQAPLMTCNHTLDDSSSEPLLLLSPQHDNAVVPHTLLWGFTNDPPVPTSLKSTTAAKSKAGSSRVESFSFLMGSSQLVSQSFSRCMQSNVHYSRPELRDFSIRMCSEVYKKH